VCWSNFSTAPIFATTAYWEFIGVRWEFIGVTEEPVYQQVNKGAGKPECLF
jgi:hypothetical protein